MSWCVFAVGTLKHPICVAVDTVLDFDTWLNADGNAAVLSGIKDMRNRHFKFNARRESSGLRVVELRSGCLNYASGNVVWSDPIVVANGTSHCQRP